MPTEVGSAYVTLIPSMQGFGGRVSRLLGSGLGAGGGSSAGVGLGRALGGGLVAGLGAGLAGGAIGKAIGAAGDFDKTIRTIGATSGISGAGLKDLSKLALDFGAKTTFSAQGAADAMLELSKGGLTAAQIKAGALASTLTLASAGGLELGNAAGYVVQGLTSFGLQASQAGQVSAALAGAANASTASVESIGQALSQVGPGARNAGLSIQETTAALAAFDNAGIKGSDAGTSLKTFLNNLVPVTKSAKVAFFEYGLTAIDAGKAMQLLNEAGVKPLSTSQDDLTQALAQASAKLAGVKADSNQGVKAFTDLIASGRVTQNAFTNTNGSFKSLAEISGVLRAKLGGLTAEQKTAALATLFGSDASRAATVLANQGADGLAKLVRATSDQSAATNLAKVGTQGYAGALEAFKGSVETAQISLGTKLLPAATGVLNFLTTRFLPGVSGVGSTIAASIAPAGTAIQGLLDRVGGGSGALSAFRAGFSGQTPTGTAAGFRAAESGDANGPTPLDRLAVGGALARRALTAVQPTLTSLRASLSGAATTVRANFLPTVTQIGTKLLPPLRDVGRFITTGLLPSLRNLGSIGRATVAALAPTFVALARRGIDIALLAVRLFAAVLSRVVGPALVAVTGFVNRHRVAFAAIAVTVGTFVAILRVAALVQRGYTAALAAGRAVIAAARLGMLAFRLAVFLANAALRANPVGLVVTALIALGAGLVVAYKHSQKFREVVETAFRGVVTGVSTYVKALLTLIELPFKALGKVPGVGKPFKAVSDEIDKAKKKVDGFATSLDAASKKRSLTPELRAQQQAAAARSGAGSFRAAEQASRRPETDAGGSKTTVYELKGNIVASDPSAMGRALENKRRLQALAS